MMIIGAMILVYAACCFGSMKKVAYLYFAMAAINAPVYYYFTGLDTTADSKWLFFIYGYGITESYLKLLYVLFVTRGYLNLQFSQLLMPSKYLWLILLCFCHIINDAFNGLNYGIVNDLLIMAELLCFIKGSSGVFSGIADKLSPRNLRRVHNSRSSS